jgi:hypothetical protein
MPRQVRLYARWLLLRANFGELRTETVRKASEGVYSVALRTAEKALFGPFRHPYSGQVHVRSVAHTLFRTVSIRSSQYLATRQLKEPAGAVVATAFASANVATTGLRFNVTIAPS